MVAGELSERLREVVEAPRQAFLPLPDTQVMERPGWLQLVTPSLRQGGLGVVLPAPMTDVRAHPCCWKCFS